MNYLQPFSLPADETILAAWDSQVAKAEGSPALARMLAQSGDIFPRFAARYAELRALPRSARRAVQRQLARSSDLGEFLPGWLPGASGRAMQQKLARSLAGAALLLALGQSASHAATITVNTTTPGIASDGKCSVIEAIINANDAALTHGDCLVPGDPGVNNTIVLPKNKSITLTSAYDYYYGGDTGLPLIRSQITIAGNGAKITRKSSAPPFRILAVGYDPSSLIYGDLTLDKVTISNGSSAANGGGIFNKGTLTLTNKSTISGNKSDANGGGIYNYGTADITGSTITTNRADNGGGVFNEGSLTISNSTISKNTGSNSGGGLFNDYDATISNTTVTGNVAYMGGGILNNATLTLSGATLSKNTAYYGGGLGNYDYGTASVTNSTITGNVAKVRITGSPGYFYSFGGIGGGVGNTGNLSIFNSKISGNTAKGKTVKVKYTYYGHTYTYTYFYGGFGGGIANANYLYLSGGSITKNTALVGGGLLDAGYSTIIGTSITGNKASVGANIYYY